MPCRVRVFPPLTPTVPTLPLRHCLSSAARDRSLLPARPPYQRRARPQELRTMASSNARPVYASLHGGGAWQRLGRHFSQRSRATATGPAGAGPYKYSWIDIDKSPWGRFGASCLKWGALMGFIFTTAHPLFVDYVRSSQGFPYNEECNNCCDCDASLQLKLQEERCSVWWHTCALFSQKFSTAAKICVDKIFY